MARWNRWVGVAAVLVILWLTPGTSFAKKERVAVLVGVNEYPKPGFSKLRYAEPDVERVAAELTKLGFRCVVLKGSLPAPSPLRATRANIVKQIEQLMEPLDGDDVCIVMFSGHGHQFRPVGAKDEDAFFCPVDAVKTKPESMLSLSYVIDTLLDPHVGHKLLLVDACRDVPRFPDEPKGIQASDKISLPKQTSVFFACKAKQQSYEVETLGAGTFTHCLLDGLKGGAADAEGHLTWSRLVAHVEDKIASESIRKVAPTQDPVMAGNAGRVVLGKLDLRPVTPPLRPTPSSPIPSVPAPAPVPVGEAIAEGKTAGEERTFGDLKIKMNWCPPGRFTMGSPKGEKDREDDEDQVEVTLSRGFWLGQTEVTQGLWESVMGTTPWKGKSFVKEGANYPATYVSHADAVDFCAKLMDRERKAGRLAGGMKYRLPTEAEWEYACRAGTTTMYNGDGTGVLTDYAWYEANTSNVGEQYAHEVGKKRANRWGLYDMHGNVWEWCSDWYDAKMPGGRDPRGPSEGSFRVLRGGCWHDSARDCRSAYRGRLDPSNRSHSLGFRLSLSPSE